MADDPRFAPVGGVPRTPDDARARELRPGLWQLGLPLTYPLTKRVNAYLLELHTGWCLIDCGSSLEPGWEILVHALALAGVEPAAVTLLVASHLHPDHAGLAATVIEQIGCEHAHLDARPTLNELLRDFQVPLDVRQAACHRQGVPPELIEVWSTASVAGDGHHVIPPPDRLLQTGDVLAGPGGDWRVHAVPGHCSTQIVLHDERARWAITADLVLRTPAPFVEWGFSPTSLREHHASLALLAGLAPRLLLPGHGAPVTAADDARVFAVEAIRSIEERVRAALRDEESTPWAIAHRHVAADADLDTRQSAFSTVLCVLDDLEARGELESRIDDDGRRQVRRGRMDAA